VKRFALLLFAGLFGLATLQTANAQETSTHDVTIDVGTVVGITAPGNLTISIDPSESFTGSNTASDGYDVSSNTSETKQIDVTVSNASNAGEVDDFRILDVGGSTEIPSGATAGTNELNLFTEGSNTGAQTLATGVQGVDDEDLAVQYEATVSSNFNSDTDATMTVTYTLKNQ
jgi:hypothetical protein